MSTVLKWLYPDTTQTLTDKKLALARVTQWGQALAYASPELQNDKEVVLAAVLQDGYALRCASPELQNDKAIVLAAVRRWGYTLQCASPELQNDKEIVLAAVKRWGHALQYASRELQNDKEVVLAAVRHTGNALQYASRQLQSDKAIILAAVKRSAEALQFAARSLREDHAFIQTVVKYNGLALRFVDPLLQNDKDIVYAAVVQNRSAFKYTGAALINDAVFVTSVNQRIHGNSKLKSWNAESTDTESKTSVVISESPNASNTSVEESDLQAQVNTQADQILDLKSQVLHLQGLCDQLRQEFWRVIQASDSKQQTSIPPMAAITDGPRIDTPVTALSPLLTPRRVTDPPDKYASLRQGERRGPDSPQSGGSSGFSPHSEGSPGPLSPESRRRLDLHRLSQFSIPTDSEQDFRHPLDAVGDHLDRGQQEFDRYVQQHPDLKLGSWISIVDDNPQTLTVFDNYQKACQAHMSHGLWFISQFLGRTREPLVEQIITGPFGQGDTDGDHFLYSYVDAEITDPLRPLMRPTHPRMMIDTGAMISLGTKDALQNYRPVRRGQARGLGGAAQMTYVNVKIILRDTLPVRGQVLIHGETFDPIYAQIGYPATPKNGEQWILGQNVLSMFRHNWVTNIQVTLEFPVPDLTIQGPVIQEEHPE